MEERGLVITAENTNLEDFQSTHQGISEAHFIEQYPQPFLVILRYETKTNSSAFKTMASAEAKDEGELGVWVSYVFYLGEYLSNPMAMIRIGRNERNDVCMPVPDISKFHAYIKMENDGRFTITDAGSTNGTKVNGLGIIAGEGHTLEEGFEIRLAPDVLATFHTSKGMHALTNNL